MKQPRSPMVPNQNEAQPKRITRIEIRTWQARNELHKLARGQDLEE